LRQGLFLLLDPAQIPPSEYNFACTQEGTRKYGKEVGLDANIKIDLVVIGSVVVSREGARCGKGEGFAELEYAMMKYMKAIDDSTPVVTTVHDVQVVENTDFPLTLLENHDVPLDIIVTPTQVITCTGGIKKPEGIYWDKITTKKLQEIPVLRDLKRRSFAKSNQIAKT